MSVLEPRTASESRRGPGLVPASLALAALLLRTGEAGAFPGTHGPAVSSWDTTLSTVMFSFHGGFFDGGHLHIASYSSNFTSTTGRLSAQFGLHYLNYEPDAETGLAHGIGATAMAVYGIPVAARYDNGLPKAAFTFFLGGAPSAILGNHNNYITFAVPLGIGLPLSPSRHFSVVPWFEVAPSFNVDTKTVPYTATEEQLNEWIDPETGELHLTKRDVSGVLDNAVQTELAFAARLRGGLSLVFHLGDRVDLYLDGTVTHTGREFNGPVLAFVGGALAFAWDDPPPAVLPPEKRLEREQCREIYDRFVECPFYPKLVKTLREQGARQSAEPGDEQVTPDVRAD